MTKSVKRKNPHKWLIKFRPNVNKTFNRLSTSTKMGIFRRLAQLLQAEDPYTLPFVEMLVEKNYERIRKFRVGDYRVFFTLLPGQVSEVKYIYKGKLIVLDIFDRKEAYD